MSDTTFDDDITFSIRAWYRDRTFLEKLGLWTLIAAGATAALLAMMQPHIQAAVGGALVAVGTKLLIPILITAGGIPGPSVS